MFAVVFHVTSWVLIFSIPFFLRPNIEAATTHMSRMPQPPSVQAVFRLLLIAVFYLNAYVLIPFLMQKKKVAWYIVSLVGVLAVVLLVMLMVNRYEDVESIPWRVPFFISVFPTLFILAISTTYRIIIDNVKNERNLKERQTEHLKTELSFLRSQVSPHFMFNVLNSAVSLARVRSTQLEPTLIKLSHLLRYMLYESDEDKVSLTKEREYLQNYIDLQQLRFADSVHIDFTSRGSFDSYLIEPMLLIPFVENAFKHGIGFIDNPEIHIKMEELAGELHFEVKNKFNPANQGSNDKHSGIGLVNVERRLNLLYGNEHKLTISNNDNWFYINLILQLR
jgi:sensor histidine kinase YesM